MTSAQGRLPEAVTSRIRSDLILEVDDRGVVPCGFRENEIMVRKNLRQIETGQMNWFQVEYLNK